MASRTLKLTIEYDGTDFVGWQIQQNGRSVQAEIEAACERILRHATGVTGAGRTDAGVHARAQVAHLITTSELPVAELHHSLNAVLPEDISIIALEDVHEGFHARYDATARRYKYFIAARHHPLARRYEWRLKYALDLSRMNDAAARICGEHDFGSFCRTKSEVHHHRCTVVEAKWISGDGRFTFDITADRFLHGMVRTLVGTMVDIGRGFIGLDNLDRILADRDRRSAGMAAPPHGLVLWEILYENPR